MASERNQLIWGEIVARAWRDPDYKQRLIDNPKEVLIEAGSSVPDELEVRVVENTSDVRYLVLPESPEKSGERLTEKALTVVSGGGVELSITNTTAATEVEAIEASVIATTEAIAVETSEGVAAETSIALAAEVAAAVVVVPILIS
jgi:hypothetical protein